MRMQAKFAGQTTRQSRARFAALMALAVHMSLVTGATAATKGRLNDTGQTVCIDPATRGPIECVGSQQDGEFGRDIDRPGSKDGRLGFSFNKIASDGTVLSPKADQWVCVEDQVTRLIWEVKTDDGGFRDKDNLYSNFGDGRDGDASAFVDAVNEAGLCGYRNWRLPSRTELLSLVDFSKPYPGPAIDSTWFPNTMGSYWTGTSFGADQSGAWLVYFEDGWTGGGLPRNTGNRVRLVRAKK